MAIIRKSKSGKSMQFIDDQGNMFITSMVWLNNFLDPENTHEMLVLSRLPLRVSPKRFKKSPLHDPDNLIEIQREKDRANGILTDSNDSLSIKQQRENKQMNQYKDESIWEE